MTDDKLTRRRFIQGTGAAAVGSLALLSGACGDPKTTTPVKDMGRDAGRDMAGDMQQDMGVDANEDMNLALAMISKAPFVQIMGPKGARLRFETPGNEALDVRLEQVSGPKSMAYKPMLDTQQVDFTWPPIGSNFRRKIDLHDDPGIFSMQEVMFKDLKPGERYKWLVHLGEGQTREGEFTMAKTKEESATLGWISDTMHPFVEGALGSLKSLSPDFIVHGGDFQYMTNPLDTWNGMFRAFGDVLATAPFHLCIGNHEYEDQDEFNTQFRRIFGTQSPTGTFEYQSFDYGPARMIILNSETDFADPNSAQWAWMTQQLTQANDKGLVPIVAFHRPFFTFSRSKPNFESRDVLHPMFVKHKVPIVFTGHNHCYERFEVDDMVYIMDGGGGALNYNVDYHKEEVIAERPSDEALRKNASKTYGAGALEIKTDGTLRYKRVSEDGTVLDDITLGK